MSICFEENFPSSPSMDSTILGEINNPGLYNLTNKEGLNISKEKFSLPTLIDGIRIAGGITNDSNIKNIALLRLLPGEDKNYKETTIDLSRLFLNGDQINNPYLFDGDVIKISAVPANQSTIKPLRNHILRFDQTNSITTGTIDFQNTVVTLT